MPFYGSQVRFLPFNNYAIDFMSKKGARKALWDTYRSMKSDPDVKDHVEYRGGVLNYDAGTAKIYDPKNL